MIKKTNRLRASRHIKRAINKGLNWKGSLFSLKAYKKRQGDNFSRLAVVISAKSIKGAVERNRLRRRIKAAFRGGLKDLDGWDIVVFPARRAGEIEFKLIEEETEKCLQDLRSKSSEFTKRP